MILNGVLYFTYLLSGHVTESDWQPSLKLVNSDCVDLWFYQLILLPRDAL